MNSEVLVLTARLLKFLEIQEEEALVGTIKFGRPRKENEEKGSRFHRAPNFGFPATCNERPVSADGRIAIHFKQVLVVKKAKYKGTKKGAGSSDLVVKGDKDAPEVISSSSRGPADHDVYITREDAVMTITAASFEGYMADGKLEQGQKAIISNISDDPEKRKDFWNAVVRRERKPSPDVITLYPDRLTFQQWIDVARGLDRGHPLKRLVDEAVKARVLMETAGAEPAPVSLEIDGRHFPDLCARLNKVTVLDRSKLPAAIRRGRGGRVQRRFVGELPAGISEEARLKIAVAFADYLARMGMMYTVVIHAPDAHNHKKNFHLHAVAYDRPCRYLVGHGCWDFDYAEPVPGQHKRFRFPERQDKPGELTRSSEGGDFRAYGARQMAEFRRVFTELCNAQLRRTPLNYLYDHRSYKVMGIYQEPGKHLGTKAASLGAVGVPVDAFVENAERSWQGAFNRARAAHRARVQVRSDCRTEASVMLARFSEFMGDAERVQVLAREIDRLDALTDELGEQELQVDYYRLTLNMVLSSAEKTGETCRRLLEAIEAGSAKPSECAMADEIRERLRQAEAFQQRVEDAELQNIYRAGDLAEIVRGKTTAIENTMERIRECIDAMEAQITREPNVRWAEDAGQEAATDARKIDARSRRMRAYFEAPLDYEEAWDNVFSRIQCEEIEIRPPSSSTPVYHVPGVSREELDLLLNPFFQKRSQARLREMQKYQELNRLRREKRHAVEMSVDVEAGERGNPEAEESKSRDREHEQVQREAVPERVWAPDDVAHERSGPVDRSVQPGSVKEGSDNSPAEITTQEVSRSQDEAGQPKTSQEPQSQTSGVRDAFAEKLSRGTKKRSESPLRSEARKRGEEMTPEEAAAAVHGVMKAAPERPVGDSDARSMESASNHPRSADEPQRSVEQPGEDDRTVKNPAPIAPISPSSEEGITAEEWKWFKNGGRGR